MAFKMIVDCYLFKGCYIKLGDRHNFQSGINWNIKIGFKSFWGLISFLFLKGFGYCSEGSKKVHQFELVISSTPRFFDF